MIMILLFQCPAFLSIISDFGRPRRRVGKQAVRETLMHLIGGKQRQSWSSAAHCKISGWIGRCREGWEGEGHLSRG
jgi:hypothetical protein